MRRLFRGSDISRGELRWGEQTGRWRRIAHGVYGDGAQLPSPLERALAPAVRTGGVVAAELAAVMLGLDGVQVRQPRRQARAFPPDRVVVVDGIRCTDGLQTLLDLAAVLDDDRWEQALESALRKRLVTIPALEAAAAERRPGARRIRRVLALRPQGAPPTESLLETLMVQLARRVFGLRSPSRQIEVRNRHGDFVARVDLAWPEIGLFVELDGQHHAGQPVYDARRETAVVAATAWLCGRFTWTEIVRYPVSTARRLADLVAQARIRPLVA